MNRYAWRASITIVSIAALAMTGWSLYVVANGSYGVPWLLAYGAVAVYDGSAIACMFLASEAVREGRAAIGALLATLLMASISVYLNITHAQLFGGSMPVLPAAVLFSSPTVALLLPAGLAWSAGRYRARVARDEAPFRLPGFGPWAWVLARPEAWTTTKARAVAHVTDHQEKPEQPRSRSASELLRRRFAEMDPTEAIRIAHDAQPNMPPRELASLLIGYGVIVDALQVAIALGYRPPEVTVERTGAPPAVVKQVPPALSGSARSRKRKPLKPAGPPGAKVENVKALLEARCHAPVVYFVRNGSRVKIGTSQNLWQRMQALCLQREDILLVLHGDRRVEQDMHREFADLRAGTSEWFELTGELAARIEQRTGISLGLPAVVDVPPEAVMVREDHKGDAPEPEASAGAESGAKTKTSWILAAAAALPDASSPDEINKALLEKHGTTVDNAYIRTVLARQKRRESQEAEGVGEGGEGYN